MKPRAGLFLPMLVAALASPGASAAPTDCAAYLTQAMKLNGEVQGTIRKALEENLDVGGASCKFRSEEWSVREEKHTAWCAGKDAAAIEQRLNKMSAELSACGNDLDGRRQMAQAGVTVPGAAEGGQIDASLPPAGSCFDNQPGFDREEAQSPLVENIPTVLADASYRIFNCARLEEAILADAFAAISLHIARRKPPVACFDGDVGVLHGTWEGHRAWAIQQGRSVAEDNMGWKINSILACPTVAQSDKLLLYADIMEALEQADRGRVERLPNVDTAPPVTAAPTGAGAPGTAGGPAPPGSSVSVMRKAPEGLGPPPMDEFWAALEASGRGPGMDEVAPPADLDVGLPPDADISIQVITATWGANCPGVQPADDTEALAEDCGGYTQYCEHLVDTSVLRDPAPGCAKLYTAEWRCGKDPTPHRTHAAPRPEISPLATDLFVTLQCGY